MKINLFESTNNDLDFFTNIDINAILYKYLPSEYVPMITAFFRQEGEKLKESVRTHVGDCIEENSIEGSIFEKYIHNLENTKWSTESTCVEMVPHCIKRTFLWNKAEGSYYWSHICDKLFEYCLKNDPIMVIPASIRSQFKNYLVENKIYGEWCKYALKDGAYGQDCTIVSTRDCFGHYLHHLNIVALSKTWKEHSVEFSKQVKMTRPKGGHCEPFKPI